MAIQWEWLELNPFRRFKIKSGDVKKERWLTSEEEGKILSYSAEWLKDIITFLLNTGMRRGELINLRWPEVDLERETIQLLITKNKERRTIPLNSTLVGLLQRKIKTRLNSGYVFTSEAGTQLDGRNVLRSFKLACKNAGLNGIRLHDLRHSAASRMVQSGIDLYTVQRLLGHKDQRMTQRYAHHSIESLKSGVNVLEGHKKGTMEETVETREKSDSVTI